MRIQLIKKRDGRVAAFALEKIEIAVKKALAAVGEKTDPAHDIAIAVRETLEAQPEKNPTVETIQDAVETVLIQRGFYSTARAYIRYRDCHQKMRDTRSLVEEAQQLIGTYLQEADWKIKENSNMGFSLQGLNNYISTQMTTAFWLNEIYSPEVSLAHRTGELHLHDLGMLSAYCCGWDLYDLLARGFGGVAGRVSSSPPKHFRSALGQIVNFFYTLQGEAAGAQAFSNFDTLLAPFVARDQLTYPEVKQCLQEFIFNLNIPTRVGFQTPFTNLTFDLVAPSTLRDYPVLIGGEPQDSSYADYPAEMAWINQAFCEIMAEGDANGRIFSFPIPTYNISKEFDWNNAALDALWRMTAKYGIPYFSNFVNSDLNPEDARSMCCRLRLDNRELRKRGGGLFGANPMTGSIGVVTLNLPRLAYTAKHDSKAFFDNLNRLMGVARNSLSVKRKVIERFTEQGLYPYSKVYLSGIKQQSGQYWANHFNTIGVLGMEEACQNFLGVSISQPDGRQFAVEILDFIRTGLQTFQEEDGMLYNLEATPGESTAYRFALLDTSEFPGIKTAGTDQPYYTNSTHLPVGHTHDIFEALTHQDDLQVRYTGGTVLHGFLGESIDDPLMAKVLVKRICEQFHLPYFTLTPTFSICPIHGYIKGRHHQCPVVA